MTVTSHLSSGQSCYTLSGYASSFLYSWLEKLWHICDLSAGNTLISVWYIHQEQLLYKVSRQNVTKISRCTSSTQENLQVKKFKVTSSSSDSKQTHIWYVLNEEELHETATKLETTPWKSFTQLSQQMGVPASLPQYSTQLLQLHLYICVIHKHYKTDQEA